MANRVRSVIDGAPSFAKKLYLWVSAVFVLTKALSFMCNSAGIVTEKGRSSPEGVEAESEFNGFPNCPHAMQ